jgi:4-coumarate--CoA ligase
MTHHGSARPDGPSGDAIQAPEGPSARAGPDDALPPRSAAWRLLHGQIRAFLAERGMAQIDAIAETDGLAGPAIGAADDLTAGATGLDSLTLLELLSRLTRVFELQRTGVEDYMLVEPRLSVWAEHLERHWHMLGDAAGILFRTSGSTGAPKDIRHRVDRLRREADHHAVTTMQVDPERIVSMVPSHHIYGAIFTAFLPERLGRPVLDLAQAPPSRLAREGRAGDLVVATPFIWDVLLRAVPVLPEGMHGVVSAAPTPADLWPRAEAAGLCSLTEIYGATETGGVGRRSSGDAPFELLPELAFAPRRADQPLAIRSRGEAEPLDLQDRLERCGPRHFRVEGRKDGIVQIGGVNVSPDQTRRCIAGIPGVAGVAVRARDGRLHAFVVPDAGISDVASLLSRIRAQLAEALPPPARPETLSTGRALPRDGMGKLRDWLGRADDDPPAP